ncbi:MAG: non-hydrolyzing UDP-N-acetylglucosamine 2-epimerase [Chitinophagaceae bacterium]|jgi:UDP-N-acetylglucosamine 2-epimerase (non-hydrolysing)
MRVTIVAGARPNFMKIAPIIRAIRQANLQGAGLEFRLVHTGQHYDKKMSQDFFDQLGIPEPDANLAAGGGTQAEQTAAIMIGFERELMAHPTDLVMVVGDVTSTMACAITARKLCIKVAHVEAGIRSGDWRMPEEVNRIVTDSISDWFFTTSESAGQNLIRSGVSPDAIFFVGNTMIDTLHQQMDAFMPPALWQESGLISGRYLVMTLHRPSNVDDPQTLRSIIDILEEKLEGIPVVFPVHPRTRANFERFGLSTRNIILSEPLSYLEFNYLVKHAKGVITDSGGITEETTVMGIPCITLRDSTERPETCTIGTNELIGNDPSKLREAIDQLLSGRWKKGGIPPLWDGRAAERIVSQLVTLKDRITAS